MKGIGGTGADLDASRGGRRRIKDAEANVPLSKHQGRGEMSSYQFQQSVRNHKSSKVYIS